MQTLTIRQSADSLGLHQLARYHNILRYASKKENVHICARVKFPMVAFLFTIRGSLKVLCTVRINSTRELPLDYGSVSSMSISHRKKTVG